MGALQTSMPVTALGQVLFLICSFLQAAHRVPAILAGKLTVRRRSQGLQVGILA
jgi:hypothetical protein